VVTRQTITLLGDQATMVNVRSHGYRVSQPAYPFRYPPLRPILSGLPTALSAAQVDRLNDLGALLAVAAARSPAITP